MPIKTNRPLEVYGHDGKATNVTMLPGDMVLYESHSVLHGRPFPLKGRFMANIFIHFEPVGHSLRHNAKESGGGDMNKKYKDALQRGSGGHETDLPPYVIPGSKEEAHWRQQHPGGIVSDGTNYVLASLLIVMLGPILTHTVVIPTEIWPQVFRDWIYLCTQGCPRR